MKEKIVNSKLRLTRVSILFVFAMVAACGGGGGGGDGGGGGSTAAPPPNNSAGAAASDNVPSRLYVANRVSNDVSAYTIDASTGALSEVPGSPFAAGIGPISVTVDPGGKFAYVANGGSSNFTDTISVYTINPATGALTSIGAVPAGRSSLRSITVDPTGKFAYTASGGSRTSSFDVSAYTINATTGALSVATGSPFFAGTNPSSVAVDPSGKFAYVTNQASSDVSAYAINAATGALISTVRASTGTGPLCIRVDPSGKFAYVVSDAVSAYSINASTGALTSIGPAVAAGTGPGSVAVDPSGRFAYVTNFSSNDVSAYVINATTGELTSTGAPVAAGAAPNSVTVDPSGKFVYVTNGGSDNISIYTIDAANGALTSLGAPVATGAGPASITNTGTIR